jgi:hypothetical protein
MKENSGLQKGHTDMITAASVLTSLGKSSEKNEVVSKINMDQNDRSKNKININFPSILMEILNNDNNSNVISWLHHGKSFFIKDKETFSTQILPFYFKQSKYTSFMRKLNRWGFNLVRSGRERGVYYHRLFQRGNPIIYMQIPCKVFKSFSSEYSFLKNTNISRKISNKCATMHELAAIVKFQKQRRFQFGQQSQSINAFTSSHNPTVTHRRERCASTDLFLAMKNPNSDFSVSVVREAIAVLQRSNNNSIPSKDNSRPFIISKAMQNNSGLNPSKRFQLMNQLRSDLIAREKKCFSISNLSKYYQPMNTPRPLITRETQLYTRSRRASAA